MDQDLAHVGDVEQRGRLRQWRCSAMMPAGYCTGRAQPAKSTILAPSSRCSACSGVRRGAASALRDDGSLKAQASGAVDRRTRRPVAKPPLSQT